LDLGDRGERVRLIREVDLDVILGARLPWAIFGKRMAGAGDDAPTGGREALDRSVPDAAACSGEKQSAARLICLGTRHGRMLAHGYRRVLFHGPAGSPRRNSMRSCRRKGRSCQNSITSGTMRKPDQFGGRGTSPSAYLAA